MLEKKLKIALKEFKRNNFSKAEKLYAECLSIDPNLPEVHNLLGNIKLNSGNIITSINYFKKAIELKPNFSGAFCNLGLAYKKLKNNELALENYYKAINLNPKNFKALFNLATYFKEKNDIENAEKFYLKTIDVMPNLLEAHNNLFELYDGSNQINKIKIFLNNMKANLGEVPIYNYYLGIYEFRKKNFQSSIEILESFDLDEKDFNKNIIKAGILAKSYDSIKDYKKAFRYFTQSNNIFKSVYEKRIDPNNYINFINKRINFFTNQRKFQAIKFNNSHTNNDPVFLVGFPRSGTTLLDTILRTHDLIDVLEELPLIDNFINILEKKNKYDLSELNNTNKMTFESMRNIYFDERNKHVSYNKDKIVIDKLPLNIIHAAEISYFFPSAKFILALRNPYDVVLSCFMQQFGPNRATINFTSIEETAKLYDLVMNLWFIYIDKFNLEIHQIKYENVVKNFELTIKNLLNFLDLEWSEKLLNFNKTALKRGIINTPSSSQVNQPLYNKSIDRWKNYENQFNKVKIILDKWVLKFNY